MRRTPLWFDIPGAVTITNTFRPEVPIPTTGHNKGQFTAVLADGRKLKPYVVFKGVRHVAERNKFSWCGSSVQ